MQTDKNSVTTCVLGPYFAVKGSESSSQFRWFTIAKTELWFLIFFVLILGLRFKDIQQIQKDVPPKKVFGNSEIWTFRQNHSSLNY